MTATNSKTTKNNSLKKCIHVFLILLILLAGTALTFGSAILLDEVHHEAFHDVSLCRTSKTTYELLANDTFADFLQAFVALLCIILTILLVHIEAKRFRKNRDKTA